MLDFSANTLAPLAAWASPLIGAPFAPHARGPDAFDCWGLVHHVRTHVFGDVVRSYADAYRATDFAARGDLEALILTERAQWRPVARVDVGAVLLCTLAGKACHVALAAGAGHVLHCIDAAGVVCAPLRVDDDGAPRLGLFRIVGAYVPGA